MPKIKQNIIFNIIQNRILNKKETDNTNSFIYSLSAEITAALLPEQQQKIYQLIKNNNKAMNVNEISKALNMESKYTSAVLNKLYKTTLLLYRHKQPNGHYVYCVYNYTLS